jgi:lipopolysaccharide transport system permease protein
MQHFSIAPREMVASLWRNRYLIKTFIQREVVGRYRGSFMGILWSFFNPVFMLSVYTFVFSVVFKARWHSGSDSKTQFALILFAGLMVFNLFAECVNRAPGLILGNTSYVKKVVFPLEILPLVNIGGALFHLIISFAVWLLAYIIFFGTPHLTILLLPVVLLPLILFTAGISWWLASIGVYLRDVSQVINIVTTALLFISPIFYSTASLPEKFQFFMQLNPLTPVIEQTRDILFWNKLPDLPILAFCYFFSIVVACLGFAWFQKTRKGFADVL